jgi:hypothetical protein
MSSGFSNKPKILRGAFVEYGLSLPPLFVVFQFNPLQLARQRKLSIKAPGDTSGEEASAGDEQRARSRSSGASLRRFHQSEQDLLAIRDNQIVDLEEESLRLDLRFDATDGLEAGDPIAEQYGVAPQIATLESMVLPKEESLLGELLDRLSPGGFSSIRSANPPLILFVWGRKRILPVNIHGLTITESEFSTELNPVRATVRVELSVIEGDNVFSTYSRGMREGMTALNMSGVLNVTNIVIPG